MPITTISSSSWQGIINVQKEAYTNDIVETIEVLQSKWQASPNTCFIYQDNNHDILGYILAHPWNSYNPPKLFEVLAADSAGDILYLHDLAVSGKARGLGVGKQLSNKIIDIATSQPFLSIMLVAVQGAEDYWFNLGFRAIDNKSINASYGKNAKLMLLRTAH